MHHLVTRVLAAVLTTALISPVLGAQTGQARYLITATDVAVALEKAGLHAAPERIELPGSLRATTPTPELHISATEVLTDSRLRVRLGCRGSGACPSFLATIALDAQNNALAPVSALEQNPAAAAINAKGNERVLAGQHAMLLMEDAHMRILLPVVAIDSGTPGTEVRVSSLDRKQTFRGIVGASGTVKGNLP